MLTSNNLKVSEHIEVSIGHPIHGAPAKLVVGDDEAFVIGFGARGSANGGVAAFTSSNCAEIWRYMIDAAVEGPCACDTTGRVIFGDYNGCLHILNTPSLEKRTSQTLGSPILNPPLLLDEANVIVAASNGVIATIDPRTGRIIRTAQANVRITSELIIGPRGKIISTTATGSILQFDPINGILTTIHDHKLLLYVAPVFIDDTTAVLADSRGSVSAISIAGSNPATPIWQFHAKGGIRYSPTLKDGKLFLAAQDHYLYALDARTGKEMWRYEMYGGATTRPLVLRGLVIVADNRAHIYAIDDETGKLVWLEMAGKRIKNADDPSVLESPQVFGGFALVGQQLIFGTYSGIVCSWPYPMNQWEHVATRAARDKRYDDAINTWLSSGQTDARMRAAKLMNEHSQFLRAAALFIQAGHRLEAAQSYEEAARLALSSDLWLEAANLWRDLKELERAYSCQKEASRIGQQPIPTVRVTSQFSIVEGEFSIITFEVSNDSPYKARDVQLEFALDIEAEITQPDIIPELTSAFTIKRQCRIRPLQAGEVKLILRIQFNDANGHIMPEHSRYERLRITPKDNKSPVNIQIETLFAQPAHVTYVHGNVHTKGDFVGRDKTTNPQDDK